MLDLVASLSCTVRIQSHPRWPGIWIRAILASMIAAQDEHGKIDNGWKCQRKQSRDNKAMVVCLY